MKTSKIFVLSFLYLFILWIHTAFASSASFYYSDGPWSGRIVDAETKEPIEGGVVVAIWYKIYSTPTGDSSYFFDAVEVLTDKDGRFLIPQFKAVNWLPIIRRIEGPNFEIFKPGYTAFPAPGLAYFQTYFPNSPLRVDKDALKGLFKKGVVIELRRLKEREDRMHNIPRLPTDVRADKLPFYYRLIEAEERDLAIIR